jgi:membrane fusion protein, multidrug efflux system
MNFSKITIIACLGLVVAGCGPKKAEVQTDAVREERVRTTILDKSVISREVQLSTILQGYETMSVAPSVTGTIEHIYVEVGDKIKKGDMLVRMDQNQYNTTKLTYATLTTDMERMEALHKTGSISQQTYDQTKLSYDQTKESLDFLEANTFVKGQFSGVISAKNYEDGELYSGQPILTLTQISTLKALINIPEQYFPLVKAGMKVNVTSEIYPDKVFGSTMEVVYPTIDATSHTFQVKLKIPNSQELLRPGMYVRTKVSLGQSQAIVVPYQAVMRLIGSNERYVFINNGGYAKRVFVKLGQRFDEQIEIISKDINVGDELVIVGQAKLIDGVKLNIAKGN